MMAGKVPLHVNRPHLTIAMIRRVPSLYLALRHPQKDNIKEWKAQPVMIPQRTFLD